MIFALDIPEPTGPQTFPGIITAALIGNQYPNYQSHAMLISFVRFVEAAHVQYRLGREGAQKWVAAHGSVRSFLDASSAFETCLVSMHRAVRCMRAIRSRAEVSTVAQALFPTRPTFMVGSIQNRLSKVRNAIQHNDEMVFTGQIPAQTAFMLTLAGTDVPTPMPGQPDQTTKTWDSVEIATHRISFTEICGWLEEMSAAAEAISAYQAPT